ncbi:MAG: Uma2 family endonuclease, partial [Bacteroidota bacterium]
KDLGKVHDETALVSLTRNDYLPDIAFFPKEKSDKFSPNTWKYPAPDLAIEILSKGTAKTDRGIKKQDYAKHGTKEYWLIDPDKQTVEQFMLNEDTQVFELFTKKTITDQITVQTIADCTFPVKAIFDEKEKMEVVKNWMR